MREDEKKKAEKLMCSVQGITGMDTESSKLLLDFIVNEIVDACEYNLVESWNSYWWNNVKKEINKL